MQASVYSNSYRCQVCGTVIWEGTFHSCGGTPGWLRPATQTIQRCPVCEGRGNVPAGFYSRLAVGTDTTPETCQTCDGKSILGIGFLGAVEKVT